MQHPRPIHRPAVVIATGLLVVGLTACGGLEAVPEIQETGFVREAPASPRADERGDDAAIIAEVALDDGGLIRFIDESAGEDDGAVGILEFTAPDAAPVAASFREEQVTPLEVFRAVAPDRQLPDRLVTHHRATAVRSSVVEPEPRSLSLDADAGQLQSQDGGVLWSWCSNSNDFRLSYLYNLHYPNDFAQFGFGGDLWGTHYGVTGRAARRALSVCNHPNATGNTGVSVWREYAPNQWIYVQGTSYSMVPHRGMWYASHHPYYVPTRYRVYASGGYYSIAGSWGQE